MEYLEHTLSLLAGILKLILESISTLCVLVGLLKTGQLVWRQNQRWFSTVRRTSRNPSSSLADIRLDFGRWLSLALEFQLGADIVNTTVAPSFEALGKLGVTALIRTFLNFFLSKELAEERTVTSQSDNLPSINIKES
jgi:uncharacterized membrane protein